MNEEGAKVEKGDDKNDDEVADDVLRRRSEPKSSGQRMLG